MCLDTFSYPLGVSTDMTRLPSRRRGFSEESRCTIGPLSTCHTFDSVLGVLSQHCLFVTLGRTDSSPRLHRGSRGLLWSRVKRFSRGSVRTVPTTDTSSNPISTHSNKQVEVGRNRRQVRGTRLIPWTLKCLVGQQTFLSLVECHSFVGHVWLDEDGVHREWTSAVDEWSSNLTCRVILWTTVFTCPDFFVSVSWDGLYAMSVQKPQPPAGQVYFNLSFYSSLSKGCTFPWSHS